MAGADGGTGTRTVDSGEEGRMSRMLCAVVGVAALAVVALASGCGSDSGAEGTTSTMATEATITGGAGGGLTAEQWATYETSRTALRKANADAAAVTKKCLHGAKSAEDFQNIPKTQACVDDVFTDLQQAAGDSLAVLRGFSGSVSGSCESALNDLISAVGLYQASAAAMQRTIDSPTLAGYPAASQDMNLALTSGQSEAQTFDQECKPA